MTNCVIMQCNTVMGEVYKYGRKYMHYERIHKFTMRINICVFVCQSYTHFPAFVESKSLLFVAVMTCDVISGEHHQTKLSD